MQKIVFGKSLTDNKENEESFSSEFLLFHNCLYFTGIGLVLSLPMKKAISSCIDPLYYILIIYLIAYILEWALSSYISRNQKYALYYPRFEEQYQNARIQNFVLWIFLILLYMLASLGTFIIGCVLIAS